MTQANHYRECLLRMTWDNKKSPSVLVPLGDFCCLGHSVVNSFQSLFFTASSAHNNRFNKGTALNCYVRMPFGERAVVELVNELNTPHRQYFYIDHETFGEPQPDTSISTQSSGEPIPLAVGVIRLRPTRLKQTLPIRAAWRGTAITSSSILRPTSLYWMQSVCYKFSGNMVVRKGRHDLGGRISDQLCVVC